MKATPHLSSPLSLSALVLLTLTPLLWGAALFFFLLAGRSMWQNWSARKRSDRERNQWGAPQPSLPQRWRMKMGRIRFRVPQFAKRRTQTIDLKPTPPGPSTASTDTASTEPLKRPIQPVLPLFEVPSGKPKEKFVWNETKEID
jgi:hypothetical protein